MLTVSALTVEGKPSLSMDSVSYNPFDSIVIEKLF